MFKVGHYCCPMPGYLQWVLFLFLSIYLAGYEEGAEAQGDIMGTSPLGACRAHQENTNFARPSGLCP